MSEDEKQLIKLLNELDAKKIKFIIANYIKENRLHSEYIELIVEISRDYIEESNFFIERMKRDVNSLYVDKICGKNVMKNVEIDNKNWFWYARLLRDTEDETYPKSNFFSPKYLLDRLKPIIAELNVEELKKNKELYELYKIVLDLYSKYGL